MSHVTIEATGKGIKAAMLIVVGGIILNAADCVSNGPTLHHIFALVFGVGIWYVIKFFRWWNHG